MRGHQKSSGNIVIGGGGGKIVVGLGDNFLGCLLFFVSSSFLRSSLNLRLLYIFKVVFLFGLPGRLHFEVFEFVFIFGDVFIF